MEFSPDDKQNKSQEKQVRGLEILPHEKQIYEYINTIEHLKKQNQSNPLFTSDIKKLEQKLKLLKEQVYKELTPWQRVLICRHPARPRTIDYIKSLCESFHELHGDRVYSDDTAIIGGLAVINGMRCMIIGQEKGNDTESRIFRKFGMANPEGYRKALRLMELAEKFQLPVISLIDTPGAGAGLGAEERGQGRAIAYNLLKMSSLKTPIIVLVIGEGCSGGALGIGVGDVVAMLEHSYYSVISPESCASILWKDPKRNVEAASALKLTSENLLALDIIDSIIPEPLGGAHHDPQAVYAATKQYILDRWKILKEISIESLLENRYLKFRKMGRINDLNLNLQTSVEAVSNKKI